LKGQPSGSCKPVHHMHVQLQVGAGQAEAGVLPWASQKAQSDQIGTLALRCLRCSRTSSGYLVPPELGPGDIRVSSSGRCNVSYVCNVRHPGTTNIRARPCTFCNVCYILASTDIKFCRYPPMSESVQNIPGYCQPTHIPFISVTSMTSHVPRHQ